VRMAWASVTSALRAAFVSWSRTCPGIVPASRPPARTRAWSHERCRTGGRPVRLGRQQVPCRVGVCVPGGDQHGANGGSLRGVAVTREGERGQPDSRACDGGGRVLHLDYRPGGVEHRGGARHGVLPGGTLAQDSQQCLDGVLPGFRHGRLLDHTGCLARPPVGEQGEDCNSRPRSAGSSPGSFASWPRSSPPQTADCGPPGQLLADPATGRPNTCHTLRKQPAIC
jgi:hypothetical protein